LVTLVTVRPAAPETLQAPASDAGRVELADGRARIVVEAFPPDVIAAFAALGGG